jgi:hypothetical protein
MVRHSRAAASYLVGDGRVGVSGYVAWILGIEPCVGAGQIAEHDGEWRCSALGFGAEPRSFFGAIRPAVGDPRPSRVAPFATFGRCLGPPSQIISKPIPTPGHHSLPRLERTKRARRAPGTTRWTLGGWLRGRTPENDEARAPEAMRQRPPGTPTCGPLPSDMRANRGIWHGSPAPGARPMKRRRWRSPPR